MDIRTGTIGRWIGLAVVAALWAGEDEARAQYGPRAQPITGVRTGLRYQPALPSPFAGGGGVALTSGRSRFGGFSGGPGFVNRGWGYGGGYRGFGFPGVSSFSLNIGVGGLGFSNVGYGYSSFGYGGFPYGVGYPAYGFGYPAYGYGVPSLYGRYPYGSVGFTSYSYGLGSPWGGFGYGGFPYGYGYGYRGGSFGY